MNILFWNIRGLGSKGRKALKKIITDHKICCVWLNETIKQKFTDRELRALGGGDTFVWNWIPSQDHSGGLLMGLDEEVLEVYGGDAGSHFQSMLLINKEDNFKWQLINVYGPVKESMKQNFLEEIEVVVKNSDVPILIGGDFNIVRRVEEKSTGNVNTHWMNAFNTFVANSEVRELHRSGGQYTWTNKQSQPVMVMLDRVFMSASSEDHFPLVNAHSITRVGSDHNPLVVVASPNRSQRSKIFRFEAAWTG